VSRTRRVPPDKRTHRPNTEGLPEKVKCPSCKRLVAAEEVWYDEDADGKVVWYCLECV